MNSEEIVAEDAAMNFQALNLEEDIILHKNDQAWKPYFNSSEQNMQNIVKMSRKTRGILNRLTPENYIVLVVHLQCAMHVWDEDVISLLANMLFERAVGEPKFCTLYAMMCMDLCTVKNAACAQPTQEPSLHLKNLLMNLCHEEFSKENCNEMVPGAGEVESKARHRTLGNIRFIGELFKIKMFPVEKIHEYLNKLANDGDEVSVECLCLLLTTVGKELEGNQTDGSESIETYFKILTEIKEDKKISSRVRFIIQNLLDLRLNKWVPRRPEDKPKMLKEIWEDVKTEIHH